MAKAGERQNPPCPRCGQRLRLKPGTRRTTPQPLWQCRTCLETLPASECEYTPAMVSILTDEAE